MTSVVSARESLSSRTSHEALTWLGVGIRVRVGVGVGVRVRVKVGAGVKG